MKLDAHFRRVIGTPSACEELYTNEPESEAVRFLTRIGAYVDPVEDQTDPQNTYGNGGGRMLRDAIPLDPTMPFSEFEPLLRWGERARLFVAKHPSTPTEALIELARDTREIARTVKRRPNLDPAVLAVLDSRTDV